MDFQSAIQWQKRTLLGHASVKVIYFRGNRSKRLEGVLGRSGYDSAETYNTVVSSPIQDFLFDQIVLKITPQIGDSILYQGFLYSVTDCGLEGRFSWCDPYHEMVRVHAKTSQAYTRLQPASIDWASWILPAFRGRSTW